MSIRWEAAGGTDVGRVRRGNEDNLLVDAERGLFLVADGMGGHAAGEVASALAVEAVTRTLTLESGKEKAELGDALRAALRAAQQRIVKESQNNPQTAGMGTTLTACVLIPEGEYQLGHIGDSRAYRLRQGRLEQLTPDHTWVQQEIDAGRLLPESARAHPFSHVLTRVLSADAFQEPDLLSGTAQPGDLFLLATDGLTGMLEDTEIRDLLSEDRPLPELVGRLIEGANAHGGIDNITAVLLRVLPGNE